MCEYTQRPRQLECNTACHKGLSVRQCYICIVLKSHTHIYIYMRRAECSFTVVVECVSTRRGLYIYETRGMFIYAYFDDISTRCCLCRSTSGCRALSALRTSRVTPSNYKKKHLDFPESGAPIAPISQRPRRHALQVKTEVEVDFPSARGSRKFNRVLLVVG